jgi:hypothetical protein
MSMRISGWLLLSGTLLAGVILGCGPKSEWVVGTAKSGSYTATLSKRNSGALSAGSTLVSIRLSTVPDNDTHGQIVLALLGDHEVSMVWQDEHHLVLSCASCTQKDVDDETVKAGEVIVRYGPTLAVLSSQ